MIVLKSHDSVIIMNAEDLAFIRIPGFGSCSDASYDNKADCEANAGTWAPQGSPQYCEMKCYFWILVLENIIAASAPR